MRRSSDLLHFYSLLAAGLGSGGGDLTQAQATAGGEPLTPAPGDAGSRSPAQAGPAAQQPHADDPDDGHQGGRRAPQSAAEAAVAAVADRGWTLAEVDSLPVGASLPLRAAMLACRARPPQGEPFTGAVVLLAVLCAVCPRLSRCHCQATTIACSPAAVEPQSSVDRCCRVVL